MTSMVRSLSLTARRRRGGPAVLPAGVFPAVLGAFWPAAVVAVCLALAAQPALAQDVEDQLQRLQRELSDLQRQVYGGAAPPAAAGGAAPTEIGRAAGRDRVCSSVYISVGAVS